MALARGAIVAGALALLGGCVYSPLDTDHLAALPPPDSAFLEALSREYVVLGDMERAESDWRDTARFYRRATEAAHGVRVEPEAMAERDLAGDAAASLSSARERLVRALRDGARATTPVAAAKAQAGFDCWMQEQEEGHQPDDIAACRAAFEAGMVEVERGLGSVVVVLLADAAGKVGAIELGSATGSVALGALRDSAVTAPAATPGAAGTLGEQDVLEIFGRALGAEPQPPVEVRLYFETGTDRLTAESQAALPKVLDLIRERVAPGVEIAGHTDTVGEGVANDRLALQRAEVVGRIILDLGVPARLVRIDSFGERDPVVSTADGVDEPRNRRVEITVR